MRPASLLFIEFYLLYLASKSFGIARYFNIFHLMHKIYEDLNLPTYSESFCFLNYCLEFEDLDSYICARRTVYPFACFCDNIELVKQNKHYASALNLHIACVLQELTDLIAERSFY